MITFIKRHKNSPGIMLVIEVKGFSIFSIWRLFHKGQI
jgi:hypothetical protein